MVHSEGAQKALDDYLGPAFALIEETYTARLSEVAAKEPWAADKLRALALAVKIGREVRGYVEAIVLDGPVAKTEHDHLKRLQAMSPERRRILGI